MQEDQAELLARVLSEETPEAPGASEADTANPLRALIEVVTNALAKGARTLMPDHAFVLCRPHLQAAAAVVPHGSMLLTPGSIASIQAVAPSSYAVFAHAPCLTGMAHAHAPLDRSHATAWRCMMPANPCMRHAAASCHPLHGACACPCAARSLAGSGMAMHDARPMQLQRRVAALDIRVRRSMHVRLPHLHAVLKRQHAIST